MLGITIEMSRWAGAFLALLGGVGIGLLYFGGLWLTVRQLPTAQHPALLVFGSFMGRTVVAVFAIYLVMGGELLRLLACLVGILLARLLMVRQLRPERS